jgi:hypothetical protein
LQQGIGLAAKTASKSTVALPGYTFRLTRESTPLLEKPMAAPLQLRVIPEKIIFKAYLKPVLEGFS